MTALPTLERISGWWCPCSARLSGDSVATVRSRGRKDNKCRQRSKFRVNGAPMCRQHAALVALEALCPEAMADV